MKRSPPSSSSCSSNSSSSYSINEPEIAQLDAERKQKQKPKPKKRAKRVSNSQSDDGNSGKESNAKSQSSGKRSSIYRGVTRHRWTGRFEAHLWDKSCWNNVQNKKGRQVYLGAYDSEEAAARTYDLAALKYWGPTTILNFTLDSYTKEIEQMEKVTREEYLASLRRQSSGFSRGVSKYRGVARHHHNGRWEARIGRVFGNKYLYLGTYKTQEEAAAAYDMAAIEYRGANAVTNFDISNYLNKIESSTTTDGEPPAPAPETEPAPAAHEHSPETYPSPDEDHPDLMWGFLDAGFPVLDLPEEKPGEQLLDLFSDSGFEDDIDLIFGGPPLQLPSSSSSGSADSTADDHLFDGVLLDECEAEGFGGQVVRSGGETGRSSSSSTTTTTTVGSVSCM